MAKVGKKAKKRAKSIASTGVASVKVPKSLKATEASSPTRKLKRVKALVQKRRQSPTDEAALLKLQLQATVTENGRLLDETKQALEQQTATADILKVIASSPIETTPVFAAIARSANRLLGGFSTAVFRFVGDTAYLGAFTPVNAEADAVLTSHFPRPVAGFEAAEM